jgi:benzoylsuccinyl-CoA thiolase BbsB subunit
VKLGRRVYIAGVGMTPFAKQPDREVEDLGREAVRKALDDAGWMAKSPDEVFAGSSYAGLLIGQRIMRDLGITGLPITNVENACSGGATALREAITAVASGRADSALAIGVEKLSALGGGVLPLPDTDHEAHQGMTMPALYAMRAQRYLHETGATLEHFAKVVVKSRANAVNNPFAQFHSQVSVDEVVGSRMVADPLRLMMCCPTGDGAAAVLVTTRLGAQLRSGPKIRVDASVLCSGEFVTGFRDMASSALTRRAADLAYTEAGIGPADIDVTELHDAFASAEMMYYEALGYCQPGAAKELVDAGSTAITGSQPVNPGGGLLSRGHPVAATGLAQICEVTWQLRGEAEGRQVDHPRTALTHCTGGGIAGLDHGACAIHVLTV